MGCCNETPLVWTLFVTINGFVQLFQSPSLHGTVFVGTLTEPIPIRPNLGSDEAAAQFPQQSVQEIWEKKFRELSDDNPELLVTGIILFYPTYVMSYCEVTS